MHRSTRSIRPDADDPFSGWTPEEFTLFWSAREARTTRIRDSVRKALIAQGAKKSRTLDLRVSQLIDDVEMTVEVAQWRNEYSKLQSLRPLIKPLKETIKLLGREVNQYVLTANGEAGCSLPSLVSTLSNLLDHVTNVERQQLGRGNIMRYVLPQLDTFFLEATGKRLTQTKAILIAPSETEDGKLTSPTHPAFVYALLNGIAPWISNTKIQTALKNYIVDRNRREGIPSNGRPKGSGKRRQAALKS